MIWIWFGTKYILIGHILKIIKGPFKTSVPVLQIDKIIIKHCSPVGLIVSYKPSVKVVVKYNSKSISMLPGNVYDFVHEIKEINPHVTILESKT